MDLLQIKMPRVLVTGASGLLGRAIMKEVLDNTDWPVLGLVFTRLKEGCQKVDITKPEQVKKVMHDFKPDIVIHAAAEKRPDVVSTQPEASERLNVQATQSICSEAEAVGAFVLYTSTDYVFDGCNPPYNVDDKPNPLNKYGEMKLHGETVTLQANQGNLVVRLPVMYGPVEYLDESAVTPMFAKVKQVGQESQHDDHLRRYPTHVADVAYCIRQLLAKKLQDKNLGGIFHCSGNECMTKLGMAVAMAEACSLPISSLKVAPPSTGSSQASRPFDSHLCTDRFDDLGIQKRTSFKEGIKPCLQPFL